MEKITSIEIEKQLNNLLRHLGWESGFQGFVDKVKGIELNAQQNRTLEHDHPSGSYDDTPLRHVLTQLRQENAELKEKVYNLTHRIVELEEVDDRPYTSVNVTLGIDADDLAHHPSLRKFVGME